MRAASSYLGVLEYDGRGQPSRVHAVSCHDGEPWLTTACGLPTQPYPPTGAGWGAAPAGQRCGRCAEALGEPDPSNVWLPG